MLAQTMRGVLPHEIEKEQRGSQEILNRVAKMWPESVDTYPKVFVQKIARGVLLEAVLFEQAIDRAAEDRDVTANERVRDALEEADRELAAYKQVAIQLANTADRAEGDTIALPRLRIQTLGVLQGVILTWRRLNPLHDLRLGWVREEEAARVRESTEKLKELVDTQPWAKSSLPWGKMFLGLAGVGALAGGVVYAVGGTMGGVAGEDGDDDDDDAPPVGLFMMAKKDKPSPLEPIAKIADIMNK